jgi:hypothetical protein
MSGGCTDCGRKGGCESRKSAMFDAVDEALARLYPTRRWSERVELELDGGVAPEAAAALAQTLAHQLNALALFRPGGPEETCDYVYVLCLGRHPSLLEIREGLVPPGAAELEAGAGILEELYLRVALSTVAPFAAVQQVAMRLLPGPEAVLVEEAPRAGVFDPVLLPRFQRMVAVLTQAGIRHLDFGEIIDAPAGFDPGDYGERYGGAPAIANYLFFPQPSLSITTTVLPLEFASANVSDLSGSPGGAEGAFP